jgi:hypothetical protein
MDEYIPAKNECIAGPVTDRKETVQMRNGMMVIALGFVVMLAGVSSSVCLGAVFLDENSMGIIQGGTPVKWLCGEGNKCDGSFCNPLLGLWCASGGVGIGRCTNTTNWSKLCESYPIGALHCSSPVTAGWCGNSVRNSMCQPKMDRFTCQGGQVDPLVLCAGYHCTASN